MPTYMNTEAKRKRRLAKRNLKKMKTLTTVVIGLSLTLASAFAAQAPAGNTASAATPAATTTPAKKHVKKNKKAVKNATAATPAAAANPATPAK